ncbi:hypothetical protein FHR83_009313 [Actinoplanes campanulatus]|uniref:DUF4878 domain-containing protein n=1 Tax=Actinoplanes campanulatus TaxID=113559 RepID=A0A7W5ATJ7_9ACTN|nr:DUF4878 domain-containing protein [Actinoplanes campanulatus]MBB3101584.1 hypothetical protein [Actinoplanes campanulatus]
MVIIVGVVVVLCTCVVAGGYFFVSGIQEATGPARQAAEEFVADLESGNSDAAYGRLCADTTSDFTREAFVQGLSGQPAIRSHEIVGVNVSNVNGRVSATVTANLTLDSGFVDRPTFPLVQEDGQWKVCGQPF